MRPTPSLDPSRRTCIAGRRRADNSYLGYVAPGSIRQVGVRVVNCEDAVISIPTRSCHIIIPVVEGEHVMITGPQVKHIPPYNYCITSDSPYLPTRPKPLPLRPSPVPDEVVI